MSASGRVVRERAARAFRRAFRSKPHRTRWALGVIAGVAIPVALAGACSNDPVKAPLVNGGSLAGGPGIPDPCATPNEGCACETEGAVADCGRVREQHDDYVTCSMGTRTCADGEWSACVGDRITVKSTGAGSPGLKTRALGAAQVCPKDAGTEFDPCDPYCNVTPDTPGDFDAGDNFSNTDAGLTLIATAEAGVACTDLMIEPTPGTVAADGETVTVTGFGPPPVTSPAGPVTFDVTTAPPGCIPPSPFPVTWTIDQVDRAQITGTDDTDGELTIAVPLAGPINVTAYAFGTSATTTVRVKVNVVEAPTGAGDPNEDALGYQATAFGAWNTPNAGTAMAGVTWLYPYADTYLPLALPAPHIQYWYTDNGGGGTLATLQDRAVKVSLRWPENTQSNPTLANYSDFNYSVIVRESNTVSRTLGGAGIETRNPQVIIPQLAWRYFEQTARGQNADLLIQRQRAGVIEQESRRRIHFVDGQLKGAVYYNSYTSPLAGNTGAVLRIAPGATAPTVAVQPTSTGAAGGTRRCTVCHSLSLDGSRLIVNGQRPTGTVVMNQSRLYDTSNPAIAPYAVPVLADYNAAGGLDNANVPGDRYTFGGPRYGGFLYMTHGGGTGGDQNWRAPPVASNLFSTSDATNAVPLTGWPNNVMAVTPRFSPNGARLAFGFWAGTDLPQSPSGTLAAVGGGTRLAVMDFACNTTPCDGTGEGVTNARDLTPGVAERVAWPSFLPTNDAVIYQRQYRTSRSSANGGVLTNNWSPSHINTVAGALAELWMSNVPADSGTAATPTRLLALNGLTPAGASYLPQDNRPASPFGTLYHQNAGASFTITQADNCGNTGTANNVFDYRLNYLPAVSPIQAGGLSWVVFTSRRMYGSVARNDPWDAEPTFACYSGDPQTKKLWIAAIDGTFTPGTDPSHPAFYLPGQELAAGNSDGYWVTEPCAGLNQACESDDDCCSATGPSPTRECKVTSSATVPPTKLCQNISSCSMTGAACATTADCCSGLQCPAGGGVCIVVPPPPVTIYNPQSITREYVATCPHGTQAKWRFFEWQATVPASTNIQFSIQVRATATDPYEPMAPLLLSTATPASGTGPGTWYRGPNTVDQTLAAAIPPLASGDYLLVTIAFNPTMTASPTLHQWRQIFDCVPAE
jgi:hypothetical protein